MIFGFSPKGNHSISFQIHRFLIFFVRVPFAQYSLYILNFIFYKTFNYRTIHILIMNLFIKSTNCFQDKFSYKYITICNFYKCSNYKCSNYKCWMQILNKFQEKESWIQNIHGKSKHWRVNKSFVLLSRDSWSTLKILLRYRCLKYLNSVWLTANYNYIVCETIVTIEDRMRIQFAHLINYIVIDIYFLIEINFLMNPKK